MRQIEGALRTLQNVSLKTKVLLLIENPGGPNRYEVKPTLPGPLRPEYWALGVPGVLAEKGSRLSDLERRIDTMSEVRYHRAPQPKNTYGTAGNYDVLVGKSY